METPVSEQVAQLRLNEVNKRINNDAIKVGEFVVFETELFVRHVRVIHLGIKFAVVTDDEGVWDDVLISNLKKI